MDNTGRHLLAHIVSTISFRCGVAIDGVGSEFGDTEFGNDARTPLNLLDHIGDLIEGSTALLQGEMRMISTSSGSWDDAAARFRDVIDELKEFLNSDTPINGDVDRIVQGPLADALTHIGQLILLRRLAVIPAPAVAYYSADIA